MTEDEADLKLLSLANEKRKFALQIGLVVSQELQDAFERGIDHEWFTLVDVTPISEGEGVFRIFRLTEAGLLRLAAIPKRKFV